MTDFSSAIRLDPGEAELYFLRAEAHSLAGNRDAAISDLEQVIILARDQQLALNAQQLISGMQ